MKTATWRVGVAAVLGLAAVAGQARAGLIHDYELNGNFHDSVSGGPDITANGGTIGTTGYTFGANQGLTLNNPGVTDTYTIDMRFSLTDTDGYRKLIDYANRSLDAGFYNIGTALQLYSNPASAAGALSANTIADVVVSRDGASQSFTASVNGVTYLNQTDSSGFGVVSAANVLNFFMDDSVTGFREASGGFVDYIRIYDTPTITSATPEPSTLVGAGIAGLVGLVHSRRNRRRPAA